MELQFNVHYDKMPTLIDDDKDILFAREDLSFCYRLILLQEAYWFIIGVELGFSTQILDMIQNDTTRKCSCLLKLLDAWIKRTWVQRNFRRGGPKLSHLVRAIGLFDTGFAEDLLENCKLMIAQEEETLKRENNNTVDKASSPIQIPNHKGNESVGTSVSPKLQMLVIHHTSFEETMFNEALHSSLRYIPSKLSSDKCICKTLQKFPEIKTFNKPPKSIHYPTNQCYEQQFAVVKKECPNPDLSVFVIPPWQSRRVDDEALVYQYMKQMGVSMWQKTLIVMVQEFKTGKKRMEADATELIDRRKSRIMNKINTTFNELRTPAVSRRYPAFITIKEGAGDWKNDLYDMMRETCSPSGREGFDIMLENT